VHLWTETLINCSRLDAFWTRLCLISYRRTAPFSSISLLQKQFTIQFGQIYLSKPTIRESDGVVRPLHPNQARLRNLTYASPLYVDVKMMVRRQETNADGDIEWIVENEEPEVSKIHIGDVPIMLRSDFCILSDLTNEDLPDVGECPYDQVQLTLLDRYIACT
jgi:DNA-directed RNA polymerase beta subunit